MCSFSEEEELPKLSEEKLSPVVASDDDDDVVITKMLSTVVRGIVRKPFAALKVSFSSVEGKRRGRGMGGNVIKNNEDNFC